MSQQFQTLRSVRRAPCNAPLFLDAGLHMSYVNYAATGEGVTSCLAVTCSAKGSERILKEKLPEYFHPFIVTARIEAGANEEMRRMIEWIPEATKEMLRAVPVRGGAQYFTEFHYNLS